MLGKAFATAARRVLRAPVALTAGATLCSLTLYEHRQQAQCLPPRPVWSLTSSPSHCDGGEGQEHEREQQREQQQAADAGAYLPPPAKLDDPEENAKILNNWRAHIQEARDLFKANDVAGAERVLLVALDLGGHFGQSSGPVATSLVNLAQLYRRSNRPAEAEPLLVRALDVLEQTAGPNNKVTLLAMLDLAATIFDLGKVQEAKAAYYDALSHIAAAEELQPHGRAALREVRAGCLFSMAKVSMAIGDAAEAEKQLREVLAMVEARHGEASARVLAPCAELARVLSQQGRLEEGRHFLMRAQALPNLRPAQKDQLELLAKQLGCA